jgi:H+/Cl- antiporter ClcA
MNGVQILNQFEVVTETVFSWNSFWIGLGIGAAVGLIAAVIFGCSEADWAAFFLSCAIFIPILGLFVGGLGGSVVCPTPVAYETRYEVSINEETNMQEFMSKYEIIETRGEIYTVREK